MIPLPWGITVLTIVAVLILLGLAERVLDRMRLTDAGAITILILLAIAHFLPNVYLTNRANVNLGGLIPIGIVVYLLATTSSLERSRALLFSFVTAGLLWLSDQVLPLEPGLVWYDIDPVYLAGVIAGVLSYTFSRSRRSAFIAAVLGILFVDVVAFIQISLANQPQMLTIASGGMFDSMIISPILAVGIAEVIGEIRERIRRGPSRTEKVQEGRGNSDD